MGSAKSHLPPLFDALPVTSHCGFNTQIQYQGHLPEEGATVVRALEVGLPDTLNLSISRHQLSTIGKGLHFFRSF
jgi:hypothetical protein